MGDCIDSENKIKQVYKNTEVYATSYWERLIKLE